MRARNNNHRRGNPPPCLNTITGGIMTPKEKRVILANAIIEDIMSNPLDADNLDIIREALESHLARYRYSDIEGEYQARAIG
jgi:hypothetical protein